MKQDCQQYQDPGYAAVSQRDEYYVVTLLQDTGHRIGPADRVDLSGVSRIAPYRISGMRREIYRLSRRQEILHQQSFRHTEPDQELSIAQEILQRLQLIVGDRSMKLGKGQGDCPQILNDIKILKY